MRNELESFVNSIKNFNSIKSAKMIDYFIYYLTIGHTYPIAKSPQIRKCFEDLNLAPYSNINAYLLIQSSKKGDKQIIIKKGNGFILERFYQQELENNIDTGPAKINVKKSLTNLLTKIKDPNEKNFLQEAINCYEIDARRASIIMVWNLTLSHLYNYILQYKLSDFNKSLAKDKGVKRSSVSKVDDFEDIKEIKFIELAKAAGIISNSIRKILDAKLIIRNMYAHPSDLKISKEKVNEFIKDLIENVVLKY